MREIVTLQVGQCGVRLGASFWRTACLEHHIDARNGRLVTENFEETNINARSTSASGGGKSGAEPNFVSDPALDKDYRTQRLEVFFAEEKAKSRGDCSSSIDQSSNNDEDSSVVDELTTSRFFSPRSVMIDVDRAPLECVQGGELGAFFGSEGFVSLSGGEENSSGKGSSSCGSNWARGHYTDGAELLEPSIESVRKQCEACECLQGFQMIHSIGGGTGSGFGTRLLGHLREEFPDNTLLTFSLMPSQKVSEVAVEPYNAVLALNHLVENADECVTLDNEALYDMCKRTFKIDKPQLFQLNNVVNPVLSNFTSTLRFPNHLHSTLRQISNNLVPYPRLHFFMTSHAPLTSIITGLAGHSHRRITVPELAQQCFDAKNMMSAADPRHGRYLACSTIFRGASKWISAREVDEQMLNCCNKSSSYFVEWVPNNLKSTVCAVPLPSDAPSSVPVTTASLVGNSTAIQAVFKRLALQFHPLLKRRAFYHEYLGQGMDSDEFVEAEGNMADLIAEYQQYQDATLEEEGEFDEEEYGDEY